jgi:hypothetical protein
MMSFIFLLLAFGREGDDESGGEFEEELSDGASSKLAFTELYTEVRIRMRTVYNMLS